MSWNSSLLATLNGMGWHFRKRTNFLTCFLSQILLKNVIRYGLGAYSAFFKSSSRTLYHIIPFSFFTKFICTSLVLDFLINLSCNGDAIAHISVFTSSVTNLHATTSFVSKPYGLWCFMIVMLYLIFFSLHLRPLKYASTSYVQLDSYAFKDPHSQHHLGCYQQQLH